MSLIEETPVDTQPRSFREIEISDLIPRRDWRSFTRNQSKPSHTVPSIYLDVDLHDLFFPVAGCRAPSAVPVLELEPRRDLWHVHWPRAPNAHNAR